MNTTPEQLVISLIKRRTKTPISSFEICACCLAKGFQIEPHFVRKVVNKYRAEGTLPIMASKQGYYVNSNPDDITRQIQSMQHRIKVMNRAIKGLKKMLP